MIDYNIIFGVVFAFILMMVLILILRPDKTKIIKRQSERQPIQEPRIEIKPAKPYNVDSKASVIDEDVKKDDAILALQSLGYKQREAKSRVQKAWELLGNATTEQLIKKAMAI